MIMDPNEALRMLRQLASTLLDSHDLSVAEDLAEHFQGLDEWIMRGGLLPDAWDDGYPPSVYNDLA